MHTEQRILKTNRRFASLNASTLLKLEMKCHNGKILSPGFPLQVNQKMMKSALIKDLYSEMERLKAGKLSRAARTTDTTANMITHFNLSVL